MGGQTGKESNKLKETIYKEKEDKSLYFGD